MAEKNNASAQDEYAYFIGPDGNSAYADYETTMMARVHKTRILNQEDYQFFTGTNAQGEALWGSFKDRQSMFNHRGGVFRPSIVYNPGIDRYLLSIASPYGEWMWWENSNPNRFPHFGVFESKNSLGPLENSLFRKRFWRARKPLLSANSVQIHQQRRTNNLLTVLLHTNRALPNEYA